MPVKIPLFILCLLIHAGIYLTSARTDRRLYFMAGLAVPFNTWPAWYGGSLLVATSRGGMQLLGIVLQNASFYLPFLSFLVYLRLQRD